MRFTTNTKFFSTLAFMLATALSASSANAIQLTSLAGATTAASSCYTGCGNAHYDHSNIIDGDFGGTGNTGLNSWNSGGAGGSVQVNFGAAYTLDRIELYGGYPYDNQYALSASLDGNSWQVIASGGYHLEPALTQSAVQGGAANKYGAVHDVSSNSLLNNISAQYLRYTRTGGSHWGYLYEMSVQGHVAAVPEPETYAMLLVGLGLLGGIARSRKQAHSSAFADFV